MGQRLHRMLAVLTTMRSCSFSVQNVTASSSLVMLSILIMKMLCVLIVMKKWCRDTGAQRRLVSLLIMTQVTEVPISSLSTMEVNVDDL